MSQAASPAPPLAPKALVVTMGDPAGIGAEVALKAWLARGADMPVFFLLDSPSRLKAIAQTLQLDVPICPIAAPKEAKAAFQKGLPVLALAEADALPPVHLGKPNPAWSKAVIASIRQAVELVQKGKCCGMVTNPIHKASLYDAGFEHPGHTEFLAELAGGHPVMMLSAPGLKVVPITIHIALRNVATALTTAKIEACGRILADSLIHDFGIARPIIAVAALNPHAGENGAMGDEEKRILQPAIDALRAEGIDILDPAPADTLFHERARAGYDAALCMYHDQALIPLKTIDFDRGVNTTLGLPIVRTSPDHGTAFDIAAKGIANADSFIAAVYAAAAMAGHRIKSRSDGLTENHNE